MTDLDGMLGNSTIYPPVPLPVELVDLILSFLPPTDLKTMSCCNTVCRQWYLFARPRLFCAIVFKPVEDGRHTADSFLDLLRAESPTGPDSLATLVKSLTFVVNPPPTDYGEESVPHILPLLTNLTSLTISGYARLADIPATISSSMRLTMSRVRRIELDCLEFKSDVFEVFDLFSNPYSSHSHLSSHSISLRELVLFNILPYSFMPSYESEGTVIFPDSSAEVHTLSLTLNAMVMRAALTALVQSRTPVRLSQIVRLTMHTNSFITQTIRDVLSMMPELKYFGYSPGFLKRPCSSHFRSLGSAADCTCSQYQPLSSFRDESRSRDPPRCIGKHGHGRAATPGSGDHALVDHATGVPFACLCRSQYAGPGHRGDFVRLYGCVVGRSRSSASIQRRAT